jgi:hypothetical protein
VSELEAQIKVFESMYGQRFYTQRELDLAVLEAREKEAIYILDSIQTARRSSTVRLIIGARLADLQKLKAEREKVT